MRVAGRETREMNSTSAFSIALAFAFTRILCCPFVDHLHVVHHGVPVRVTICHFGYCSSQNLVTVTVLFVSGTAYEIPLFSESDLEPMRVSVGRFRETLHHIWHLYLDDLLFEVNERLH